MVCVPPIPFITRRSRVAVTVSPPPPPPPPSPLMLTAAQWLGGSTELRVVFDRAVDIAGIQAASFFVQVDNGDGTYTQYSGIGGSLEDPQTVGITCSSGGTYEGSISNYSAGADNGIVAVDDGGTWAGGTDLALPFP
jgi:hypothetical protein